MTLATCSCGTKKSEKKSDEISNEQNDEDESDQTEDNKEDANEQKEGEDKAEDMNETGEEKKEISFLNVIPAADTITVYSKCGKIEEISYPTKDYFGDGAEITKPAFVYLPYEYDESKQYNVLYLMHGIGGNEREWGMYDSSSKVKAMMDHLIQNGAIEPFIIVVPNGRSSVNYADTSSDYSSFYQFGKELRNDLIPYIEEHYATYAEYSADGYDLTANREHRAMAGLSMGAMQTINIGMCECLDLFTYYGAFSACPTTNTASTIAEFINDEKFKDYDIRYFYNLCGTEDTTAYTHATNAVTGLCDLTDKLEDGVNMKWQTVKGVHDFNVWYLGFYNFANLVFQCD